MIKTPSLVAAYNFNGNANDESGNGNHGVVSKAILIDSIDGQGYNFIRLNKDYGISANNVLAGLTSFTVFLRFKTSVLDTRQTLFCAGVGSIANQAIWLTTYADNYIHADLSKNPGPSTTKKIDATNWISIALQCNAGLMRLFYNGIRDGNELQMSPDINSNDYMYIARPTSSHSSWDWWFSGIIDTVLVYNKALSDADIKRIYEGFSPING